MCDTLKVDKIYNNVSLKHIFYEMVKYVLEKGFL